MDTLNQIEKQIIKLNEAKLIRWLDQEEMNDYLFKDDLCDDIVNNFKECSRLFAFLINKKCFFYLIHYNSPEFKLQEFVQIFWDDKVNLIDFL